MRHPYNTGKVLIGCRYEPARKAPDCDTRLQRALLASRRRDLSPGDPGVLARLTKALRRFLL